MRSACSLDQPYRHKGASSSTDSILPKSEGLTLTPMNGLISLIYQYCLYVYDVYVRLVIVIVRSPFLIKTSHERLIWHWIIHALGSFSCGFRSFESFNRLLRNSDWVLNSSMLEAQMAVEN